MAWNIKCNKKDCEVGGAWAANILDLINDHLDKETGMFICGCGHNGYIEKHFELQEEGETWEPFLRGIVNLGDKDEIYQPFVFLVSYKGNGEIDSLWFSYFKDTREYNNDGNVIKGKLKMGYGPGGPPVLNKDSITLLLKSLKGIGYFSNTDFKKLID